MYSSAAGRLSSRSSRRCPRIECSRNCSRIVTQNTTATLAGYTHHLRSYHAARMAESPVINPDIPYVGEVAGGLMPGKMLKIHGKSNPDAVRFAINYQLGPNINPRDDIAIHLSPRFPEGFVTRNSIESMSWGPEENNGPMLLQSGQEFEIIILCEQLQYKIAINGRHFTEFAHRLPYQRVTHLVIDGDVVINSISYEVIPSGPGSRPNVSLPSDIPNADFGPPAPGGLYPTLSGGDGYGPKNPGGPGDYNNPSSRGYGYKPGYEQAEEEEAFGGCMDKVGLAVGGLIAAGGVAAAMHAYNKRKEAKEHEKIDSSKSVETESEGGGGLNLGALGAALASSLASNALHDTRPQSAGYPSHESSGGAGGVLGSILGAFGGQQQSHGYQQPPQQPASSDPFGGALGSILGGVLGGGGGGGHQPSGGYGGYGSHQPQQQPGGDLFSGLGASLLSSAIDGLTKKSHGDPGHDDRHSSAPPPYDHGNYGGRSNNPPPQPPASNPPASGGSRFNAADISKGLGLGDDED